MVRVLSCHHFSGQKIGRCEESVGVTLADSAVIVALEHEVKIFVSDPSLAPQDLSSYFIDKRKNYNFGRGKLGKCYLWDVSKGSAGPSTPSKNPGAVTKGKSTPADTQLKLSHHFVPVDLITSLFYNLRGHYLLSLEKRESTDALRVRLYFNWDRVSKGKPMRARIAGLVSPTSSDPSDSDSLLMLEVPPEPNFNTLTATSCQLTGNLATLSTDSRVHIYTFHIKEGSGRGKSPYVDFDLIGTLTLYGLTPHLISFSHNFIALLSPTSLYLIRLTATHQLNGDKNNHSELNGTNVPSSSKSSKKDQNGEKSSDNGSVFFDPRDESIVVHLKSIERANRRLSQPISYIWEEFRDDISYNKSAFVMGEGGGKNSLHVEDEMRVKVEGAGSLPLVDVSLHPVRIKNSIGGMLCFVCTSKEAYLYHLPELRGVGNGCRVTTYAFTAPLIKLVYDNNFVHALTTTGLETYSSRGLYQALAHTQGFSHFISDCPFKDDSPSLLGIRPFPSLHSIVANERGLCLLAAPPNSLERKNADDSLWTIYLLESPSPETVSQDLLRSSELHKTSNLDSYFTLLSELYCYLRSNTERNPEVEESFRKTLREVCKKIGFAYFKKAKLGGGGGNPNSQGEEKKNNELGVTYLAMANIDIAYFFTNNTQLLKDETLGPGIANFIQVFLPSKLSDDESSVYSPSLTKSIAEFLISHSPSSLVKVVIDVPWFRDCQSSRLLIALRVIAASERYHWRETLALILTIVAVQGTDGEGIDEISRILVYASHSDLEEKIKPSWLLERKKNKLRVSELAICLAMSQQSIVVNVLRRGLMNSEVGLDDILLSFQQGVNLSSDPSVKEKLTLTLTTLLELYYKEKSNQILKEEEVKGVKALVRSYLVHIQPQHAKTPPKTSDKMSSKESLEKMKKAQKKFPNFIPIILKDLFEEEKGGEMNFSTNEARSSFMKLCVLLNSSFGKVEGVKELVLSTIKQQNSRSKVHAVLEVLAQSSPEESLSILISNYPEAVMTYAKETFERSDIEKWKFLVQKLKEKIQGDTSGVKTDLLSTIIESLYLHLANSLSPSELESVLEKEEESEKYYATCKRIELANSFADQVVKLSSEFLNRP